MIGSLERSFNVVNLLLEGLVDRFNGSFNSFHVLLECMNSSDQWFYQFDVFVKDIY